jgi:DNA-binding protein H-NS
MTTLNELVAQRSALDEKIKALTESGRAEAIAKVKALMQENGLSVADLGGAAKSGAQGKGRVGKGNATSGKKVAAKYRDNSGNAWSGRGLQPKWLKAALAAGKKIEDFAV